MGFGYITFIKTISIHPRLILEILAMTLLFLLSKRIAHWCIAVTLDIKPMVYYFLFNKNTFNNYSGIILLICNFFLIYTNFPKKMVLIIGLFLIVVISAIGFLNSLKRYQNFIRSHFIYFLLYICTLEISPYILAYKMVSEHSF